MAGINVNLLAHIALDSELSGRFGVQGNTFRNTFGFLDDYLNHMPNRPEHLDKLVRSMRELVATEASHSILNSPQRSEQDLLDFTN